MTTRTSDPDDGEGGAGPQLAGRLAALPRELAPSRDLWPGIAARLGAPAASLEPAAPPVPFPRRPAVWRQLAAALVAAAIGAGATWLAMGGGQAAAIPANAAAAESDGSAVPASFEEGRPDPALGDYRLVEADYLRAKEALWVSVYARRGQFSPATLQAVEKNFAIIDQAIFDLRQALSQDPGNRNLEEELYRNHRRGLDLLRRLADST